MWQIKRAKDYEAIRDEMLGIWNDRRCAYDYRAGCFADENVDRFDILIEKLDDILKRYNMNLSSNKIYEINELLKEAYHIALIIKLEN